MRLFKRLFKQGKSKPEVYPIVPEGMKGVFMKGIGMHWAQRCKPLVEGALKDVKGVQDFTVEAPPKDQAFIVFDPTRVSIDMIQNVIIETGYDVKNMVELDS